MILYKKDTTEKYYCELTDFLDGALNCPKDSRLKCYLCDVRGFKAGYWAIRIPGRTVGNMRVSSDLDILEITIDESFFSSKKVDTEILNQDLKSFLENKIIL